MDKQPSSTSTMVRTVTLWAVASVLAVVMTWPLVTDISRLGRTANSGDARYAVWNVAWVANALLEYPTRLYDANIFHPHRHTLAYSEANVGAGLIALPAWAATRNPFTAHNVVVLFSFVSSFVATFLLVSRLVRDELAAATAGVLYAFCPYLFSHTAHIQLLLAFGIPLSMLAFHQLVDTPTPLRGVWLGLALTAAALSCAYYGIFAGMMVGSGTFSYAFSRHAWRDLRYWRAIAIGAAVSLGIVVPFFLPYLAIQEETGFARSLNDARAYAATFTSYLASGAKAHRWMLPLIGRWGGEVLFPGFIALALAALGTAAVLRGRRERNASQPDRDRETAIFYGSIAIVSFWATLGPAAGLYTVLYYALPVFSFLRAPGRMGIVVVLCLALFAAYGVRLLRETFRRQSLAVGIAAAVLALVDLQQIPFDWRVERPFPRPYMVLATLPRGAVTEFPFHDQRIHFHLHTTPMLRSTVHWQPLVNGYSDHIPRDFREIAPRLASFPSRDAFAVMRERRVRYFTIDRARYGEATAADVEARLVEFQRHVKLIVDEDRVALYEIVSWPDQ
jgi:hypothetical protein